MTPEDELARVMAEIAWALGGNGAALTIHPTEQPASILHVDFKNGLDTKVAHLLRTGALNWNQEHPDHHIWLTGDFTPHAPNAIALPVRRVSGHSRLTITVFFETIDGERRAAAEAAYRQRRPFAVGYFRLWQQDRLDRREVETLRAALDRFGIAVMLIAKSGEIGFKNIAACKLIDQSNGIYELRHRLRAQGRAEDRMLESTIEQVVDADDRVRTSASIPILSVKRDGMSPIMISIMPSPFPAIEDGETAAILFAVDPDMNIREFAMPVCSVFGLTRVEAELACLLAIGETLQDAADSMRIKRETARGYLRSLFIKTGVNRQADLIRIILLSLVRTSDDARLVPDEI